MGNSPQPPQPIKIVQQPVQKKLSPERKSPKKQSINSNRSKVRQSDIKIIKKNPLNTSNNDLKQKTTQVKKPQQLKQKIKQSQQQSNLTKQTPEPDQQKFDLMNDKIFIEFLFQKWLGKNKSYSVSVSFQLFYTTIKSSLNESKVKFKTKLIKNQIYPVFTSNQSKNAFEKDVLAFEIALKNHIYQSFTFDYPQKNQASIQNRLRNNIEQTGNMIMAELMGKTNIWRSLMISKQQQRKRIIQMFKTQGIDEKILQLLY